MEGGAFGSAANSRIWRSSKQTQDDLRQHIITWVEGLMSEMTLRVRGIFGAFPVGLSMFSFRDRCTGYPA